MKAIKSNMEIIVVLLIILFIFTTLVVFYEGKLKEGSYCPVSNNEFRFKYLEKIKDGYIRVELPNKKTYVINISENIVNELIANNKYKFTIEEDIMKDCDIASVQEYLNNNFITIETIK